MNPTLDDCNEVLDWMDDNFDFGKRLRARVFKSGHFHYVYLIWFGVDDPEKSGLYTPMNWVIGEWWIDEKRNRVNGLYRIKSNAKRTS